ncbi:hypothetical protein NIES4073_36150 [Kalymmatonema gypsitolerans NIES-4073]|nr:hypothetical protein NIES4073_36150 [Scytonema sp. NIES-4073]
MTDETSLAWHSSLRNSSNKSPSVPTAIAPLDTLRRIFGIKRTGVIKQLECDRYPIPDSNATRLQTSTMGV